MCLSYVYIVPSLSSFVVYTDYLLWALSGLELLFPPRLRDNFHIRAFQLLKSRGIQGQGNDSSLSTTCSSYLTYMITTVFTTMFCSKYLAEYVAHLTVDDDTTVHCIDMLQLGPKQHSDPSFLHQTSMPLTAVSTSSSSSLPITTMSIC